MSEGLDRTRRCTVRCTLLPNHQTEAASRNGNGLRLSLALLSFSLLTIASASASAVGEVVVIPFQGPPIPVVHRALYVCQRVVTSAIPPAYNLVPPGDVAKANTDRLV